MKTATAARIALEQAGRRQGPKVSTPFLDALIERTAQRVLVERTALDLPEADREQYIEATMRLLPLPIFGDLEISTKYDLVHLVAL